MHVTTSWLRVEPCADIDVRGFASNNIFTEDNNCVQEQIEDKSADKGNLEDFTRIQPAV